MSLERLRRKRLPDIAVALVRLCLRLTPAASAVDVLDELASLRQTTDLRRATPDDMAEAAATAVRDSLGRILSVEFPTADSGDLEAATLAVQTVLDRIGGAELLYDAVADGSALERRLLRQCGGRDARQRLGNEAAQALFDIILSFAVHRLGAIAPHIEDFVATSLPHLIQGQRAIEAQLQSHDRAIQALETYSPLHQEPALALVGQLRQEGAPAEPVEPIVRGYFESLASFAPATLVGREDDFKELNRFVLEQGGSWWCWRAGPWAGKTALMATLALDPPPSCKVAAFFVVGREEAANSRDRFYAQVLPQLAHIAGLTSLRLAADPSHRHNQFHDLLAQAARSCVSAGQRLLLLCDGLDEDTALSRDRPYLGSIAAVLPSLLPDGVTVVAASRPSPQLPVDVPVEHPLRQAINWHDLSPSSEAVAVRETAIADMDDLVSSTAGRDIAATVAAAAAPLTATDLSEILRMPYTEVLSVLHGRSGRALVPASRTGPDTALAYRIGHDLLDEQLIVSLNPRVVRVIYDDSQAWAAARFRTLSDWRARIHLWARQWTKQAWPRESPSYLLESAYPALLEREPARTGVLVELLTDPHRAGRLYQRYRDDYESLSQIRSAADELADRADPPLIPLGRLMETYELLSTRSDTTPHYILELLLLSGQQQRALRIALSVSEPDRRVRALVHLRDACRRHGATAESALTELAMAMMSDLPESQRPGLRQLISQDQEHSRAAISPSASEGGLQGPTHGVTYASFDAVSTGIAHERGAAKSRIPQATVNASDVVHDVATTALELRARGHRWLLARSCGKHGRPHDPPRALMLNFSN